LTPVHAALALAALIAVTLAAWAAADAWRASAAARTLARVPTTAGTFSPDFVGALPEPARRFLTFAIRPGAPLATAVEITMAGELSLGTKAEPRTMPMRARQVLALPEGFVWEVSAGRGWMRASGSDGLSGSASWTRFRLWGLVPLVRAGGNEDHLRSAFGRMVAEAAFWSPAALLPRPGVEWSQVDADTARVTVRHGSLQQAVDIRVDAAGQPEWVRMDRWTNANAQQEFRLQPFGGFVSDFRWVDGYRVPFQVDGGNFFGTPDYFPFYRARLQSVRFLPDAAR
jgi:hypothetical protein